MRIRDYLELPPSTELDAFITRLNDTEERVRQNLRLYVLSDRVKDGLETLLKGVGERLSDNRDVGRFIYGSFGSGKSHLLTVLGRMLEQDEAVYSLGDPRLREVRAANPWLDQRRVLVVRLNMMEKRSLVSALYTAYNDALPAGIPRLSFTDEGRVFHLIERDAERMGGLEVLLPQAGIPNLRHYERAKQGDMDARLELAAKLLTWRNHGEEAIRAEDLWLPAKEGFERLARHAQEHGYEAIAWLIDELVIWIRQFDREVYVRQINSLSAMVDHDAARVIPFFVALAVQTDIVETCPDDMSEKGFREQLGFIADRFRPPLYLEEQDLFEVAARRVLRRREDDPEGLKRFEDAINTTFKKHGEMIQALSGGIDPALVRRLYPFQPALLRVLMDITQALSRSRTAIAGLYGLLEAFPDLAVGEFVPLGALWDLLFAADQIQTLRQNAKSTLSQRMADTAETYKRLEVKIEVVAENSAGGSSVRELQQLVRSVLLSQLSERPYFPDGTSLRDRITASTLLYLNQKDVKAVTERTGISKVARLFRTLSSSAPQVQVGPDADPRIHIKIEQVDIERVLAQARGKVIHADRFAYIRRLLDEQLGMNLGNGHEAQQPLSGRGTKRKGRVRLENVRVLSYAGQVNEFDPDKADFLILVDYPFDEDPQKGRHDDIDTVQRARARRKQWTLTWLPEHFNQTDRHSLDNAVAVELVRKDKRGYLNDFTPRDADEIARALETYQISRRQELIEAIQRAYFQGGQIHTLDANLDSITVEGLDRARALEVLGSRILDVRYPQHPTFERRVGVGELSQIAEYVIKAVVTGQQVDLRSADMSLAKAIAVPLELVYAGESSVTPRIDGRYLARILEWTRSRPRFKASELRSWLTAEGRDGFGFTDEVVRFFLFYLLRAEGFAAVQSGKSIEPEGLDKLPVEFELVKDEVVDAPTWDRARKSADKLLGIVKQADLPSSPEQSRLSKSIVSFAQTLGKQLKTYVDQLKEVCLWAGVEPHAAARYTSASGLLSFLDSLLDTMSSAERIRRMAGMAEDSGAGDCQKLREHLGEEEKALRIIGTHRGQFEHVDRHGLEEDRALVVLALRKLLKESIGASLLKSHAEAWAKGADQRFRDVLSRSSHSGTGASASGSSTGGGWSSGGLASGGSVGGGSVSGGPVSRGGTVGSVITLPGGQSPSISTSSGGQASGWQAGSPGTTGGSTNPGKLEHNESSVSRDELATTAGLAIEQLLLKSEGKLFNLKVILEEIS